LAKPGSIRATALADRKRDLFGLDQTVFLYDFTSTYFEGRARSNGKAQRSYPRDHRGGCKRALVGLAGFALAGSRAVRRAQGPGDSGTARKAAVGDREKPKKRVAKGQGRGTKPVEVRESMGRLKERYSGVPRYYHMGYDDLQETFTYLLEASKRTVGRRRDGTAHPQGNHPRADSPATPPATRHPHRNHVSAEEFGSREGGSEIVTKKSMRPYLSRDFFKKRGSWVRSQPFPYRHYQTEKCNMFFLTVRSRRW